MSDVVELAREVPVPLTQDLADFISGLRAGDVPAAVERVLEDAVLDAIGCGLFGLTTQAGQIVRDFALSLGGPEESTVWGGGGRRVAAGNAALAVGTAMHAFDFDDHHRAKLHPGAVVFPTVFALGEQHGIDGRTCLAAIAAGYETMIRVSLAANPNASRMKGWHLTGTCGTFGAAAAASVILGLDAATTASALGLAGTQSSGLWAFTADGAMSKRLHPGRAAQSGIMAALLAQRGFHGPRQILEAADGGFLAATSDDPRPAELGRGLGTDWRTEGVCFKPYACCGSNHSSIDAAVAILRDNALRVQDVEEIRIGVSRVVDRQTGFHYEPTTVLNAQMSLRYDVAVAMLDGTALVEQFTPERIADPQVMDLVRRTRVVIDADMEAVYPRLYAGKVAFLLRDGRALEKRVDYSRGMPENKMSPAEMRGKFLSLAGGAIGHEKAEGLIGELSGMYIADDIAPLARRLGQLEISGTTSLAST